MPGKKKGPIKWALSCHGTLLLLGKVRSRCEPESQESHHLPTLPPWPPPIVSHRRPGEPGLQPDTLWLGGVEGAADQWMVAPEGKVSRKGAGQAMKYVSGRCCLRELSPDCSSTKQVDSVWALHPR